MEKASNAEFPEETIQRKRAMQNFRKKCPPCEIKQSRITETDTLTQACDVELQNGAALRKRALYVDSSKSNPAKVGDICILRHPTVADALSAVAMRSITVGNGTLFHVALDTSLYRTMISGKYGKPAL